ncbi:MAG: tRNA (N6-threonylcarbamoyladenosine(37)-N6)-methyltransferase TrmO [Ruminococcus sp.]|nr:tRNA (N6-threonylcarbamoyladenosine(37)-N6)-methyltransferase TrmO [Ruminococcus sp.]
MADLSSCEIKAIGFIKSDFPTKFGIPRQSGLCKNLTSQIVFLPQYSDENAFRGIEQFSHLWVIWGFSDSVCEKFSPTVRPPRLGGNERTGVFATRSPFRPNPLGLSCVKLERVIKQQDRIVLEISGADMKDGTPVFDVKPYIPYADCISSAQGGFAQQHSTDRLRVEFAGELLQKIPEQKRDALIEVLSLDPRPAYQDDTDRTYGFEFAGFEIKFRVVDNAVTVVNIE